MTQGVEQLIKAIAEGDAATIDAAFNSEMATRVSANLEDMRISVAQNLFKNPVAEESDLEQEESFEEIAIEEPTQEETPSDE